MAESRPRDLTQEELALTGSPAAGGTTSAPLRIPPGTQVAVELLNPGGNLAAGGSPTAEPPEGAADASAAKAPAAAPSPGKKKEK